MNRQYFFALAFSVGLAFVVPSVLVADTVATLSGEHAFYTSPEGVTEVNGKNFSVTFADMPAGTYAVEVEAAESYHTGPGQRVMDVSCQSTVIAKNWDVFMDAGGMKKPVVKSVHVQRQTDDINGPLVVDFSGVVDKAMVNAIRIKDATGKLVAAADAATLKKSDTPTGNFGSSIPVVAGPEIWKDPAKSPEVRAADLVSRLSLVEKVSQLDTEAVAIKRLGIPAYSQESEALHGGRSAPGMTVFPQALGEAASFDDALWSSAASAISTEIRAEFHETLRKQSGDCHFFQGLNISAPNINIFRDPRWGRGQETYGEDPYLTARMGVAYVKGLQGDDPHYLKTVATAKHYAVHSGPEKLRHTFDMEATDQDLWETYFPAFQACIMEGQAQAVMGAYTRFRGESCSSSKFLLDDILRDRWGFKGYVVSDMDSVSDIWKTHLLEATAAGAAARAIKNGMDLNMGGTKPRCTFDALPQAIKEGLCTESDVNRALTRCLIVRFRLGLFDPVSMVPYSQIPLSEVDSPEHNALALRCARESMVLLKNAGPLLPLPKSGIVAVIGPNAKVKFEKTWLQGDDCAQFGNYSDLAAHPISVVDGISKVLGDKGKVIYAQGCELTSGNEPMTSEAIDAAKQADTVVMVMGLSGGGKNVMEGENHDRSTTEMPEAQEQLIQKIAQTGKPIVLVLLNGSSLAINWEKENIPAILDAWYPGQRGDAVADVLFGDYNPAGRLPITFYKSDKDLPEFTDYSMKGRTYRYFTGEPLFPFGFGLSYTTFAYEKPLVVEPGDNGTKKVTVEVKNTGKEAGDEVVQLYLSRKDAPAEAGLPIRALRGFQRVNLAPGESKTVSFTLTPYQFAFVRQDGVRAVDTGDYIIGIGGSQQVAQTATVKFGEVIIDPPYAYVAPQAK